jgi:hypothetical protein
MKFTLALIACLAASTQAKKRSLSAIGITVDGNTDDWTLSSDFLHDMYNAGESDTGFSGYDLSSKAYARHSCDTDTLCILVKALGDRTIDETTGDAWFKDYTSSNGGTQYTQQGFEWVKEGGITVGWEACFDVPAGYESMGERTVEIHADYNNGKTTSTGKKNGQKADPLKITWDDCYEPSPETATAPTPNAPTPTAPTPTVPTPTAPTRRGDSYSPESYHPYHHEGRPARKRRRLWRPALQDVAGRYLRLPRPM